MKFSTTSSKFKGVRRAVKDFYPDETPPHVLDGMLEIYRHNSLKKCLRFLGAQGGKYYIHKCDLCGHKWIDRVLIFHLVCTQCGGKDIKDLKKKLASGRSKLDSTTS